MRLLYFVQLGLRLLTRAALWLVCERWYLGMAVPEVGVAWSTRCSGAIGCRGGGPEALVVLRAPQRVGFFIYV
jgi:hypothetical protein